MIDPETLDSYLVPAIFEPWSRELIKRAQIWKGDKVLDVGTGTGIVACRIASSGATVTAVDASPVMLSKASARAQEERVNVRWVPAPPEHLPGRTPEFDLVTFQQGLQLVADRAAVAKELRRVILPGGRALVACWCGLDRQPAFQLLDGIAVRHLGAGFDAMFSLGDEAPLKTLLEQAKFFAVFIDTVTRAVKVPEPERFVRVMFSSVTDAPDPDKLDAAVAEGVAAFATYVDGEQLVFPMTSMIAMGRVKT